MSLTNELIVASLAKVADSCNPSLRAILANCSVSTYQMPGQVEGLLLVYTANNDMILKRLNGKLESLTRRIEQSIPLPKLVTCSAVSPCKTAKITDVKQKRTFMVGTVEYLQGESKEGWTYVLPLFMFKKQEHSFKYLWQLYMQTNQPTFGYVIDGATPLGNSVIIRLIKVDALQPTPTPPQIELLREWLEYLSSMKVILLI